MKSTLIKDTTKSERIQLIKEWEETMSYVAKIVYDKDNRVTEENDAHGKINEMRNRMRKIVAATEENKEDE